SSRRRHTRCYRDWSSDVCSSDLETLPAEECLRAGLRRSPVQCSRIRLDVVERISELDGDLAEPLARGGDLRAEVVRGNSAEPNRSEERRVGKRGRGEEKGSSFSR